MTLRADVLVIGAGAVGLSAAWQLVRKQPGLRVAVLDKELEPAVHQTGHNSGVIHSGLYYKPGSQKATNCVRGREMLVQFARENDVPHEVCGKVVVATTDAEAQLLAGLHQRGVENGLPDIRRIDGPELRSIEPHCAGEHAIWVPYTGIIDYRAVVRALARRVLAANPANRVHYGQQVLALQRSATGYTVRTATQHFEAAFVVGCAGLHSDRLARLDGLRPAMRIVGFRGDYYELVPEARSLVRNLIYPVPNPLFPFLGVHFTRMTNGEVECGPNAVFVFKREGYGKTDFNWADTLEALGYSGTWKLFGRHWQQGLMEYRRAFSKALFLKTLQSLIPGLRSPHIVPGRAGVRAQAVDPGGNLVDDFVLEHTDRSLHVLNAPSPAATACLAIGEQIADWTLQRLHQTQHHAAPTA